MTGIVIGLIGVGLVLICRVLRSIAHDLDAIEKRVSNLEGDGK